MDTLRRIMPSLFIFLMGVALGIGGILSYQSLKGTKQSVSVVGEGTVEAVADQVSISVQVSNTAATAELAMTETKKDVQTLKTKLKQLGVPDTQIEENSYESATPPYPLQAQPMETVMRYPSKENTSYTQLTLNLSSIKNSDAVLSAINSVPHAKITNTYYSLKSSKKYDFGAREEALKDARLQVESIARINNLRVGKLISLTDSLRPNPMPLMRDEQVVSTSSLSSSKTHTYEDKTIPVTASFRAVYELY